MHKKLMYEVTYLDEDDRQITADLQMCGGDLLCDECKKDPKHMDDCSYFHKITFDKEVAQDKVKMLKKEGYTPYLWTIRQK